MHRNDIYRGKIILKELITDNDNFKNLLLINSWHCEVCGNLCSVQHCQGKEEEVTLYRDSTVR